LKDLAIYKLNTAGAAVDRLEDVLAGLERAIGGNPGVRLSGGMDAPPSSGDVELRRTTAEVSARLDGLITRLKSLLET